MRKILPTFLLAVGCLGDVIDDPTEEDQMDLRWVSARMLPQSDINNEQVIGVGEASALWQNVDDLSKKHDGFDSYVSLKDGAKMGAHSVVYGGALLGRVGRVVVSTVVRRLSRDVEGTAQVELYDGDKLLGVGKLRELQNAWGRRFDVFGDLDVADGNRLRTRVRLENTVGTAQLAYTAVWVGIGISPGSNSSDGGSGSSDGSGSGSSDGGGGGASDGGGSGPVDAGTGKTCASGCGAFAHCNTATQACSCDPGYVPSAGNCVVVAPADPSGRSTQAVCDGWKRGHVVEDASPWDAGNNVCDPGTLSRAGINDTMRRTNMYRFLLGLYPSVDEAAGNTRNQACAVMQSQNPGLSHNPPTTWKCYSALGAQGAGSSNLAKGASAPGAIDMFINEGEPFGHRRWVLFPPLDDVGIGYAAGSTCMGVFNSGNQLPTTKWQAVPNPGPTPLQFASINGWSFHSQTIGLSNASAKVVRKSDGANMAVTSKVAGGGYGVPALAIIRSNWPVVAGETYVVTISNTSQGNISYEVSPVACP